MCINNSDLSDLVPASDILKDLELLVLTASRLNLRDKCREQIKIIERICLMIIFGISNGPEKFQFIPRPMKTGALLALQFARYGNTHMCQYFQALSNSTITAEHLRYSGVDNKGPTAIFTAIQGAVSGDTMLWDRLKTQFKDELRMDDFRTSPADGPCAGQTGLWLAVMAWLQGEEGMWNWLSHRFRGELRIDDVVIKPNSGGESILHQVNSAADEGYPVLEWIIDQLNIN